MPEDRKFQGGVKILETETAEHRAAKARGAVVVSQEGRGGISKPQLRFVGFNVNPGEGLVITESHTALNPHSRVAEVPLDEISGKAFFPGLPAVPQAVIGDTQTGPLILPSATPPPAPLIVPENIRPAESVKTSSVMPVVAPAPKPSKVVLFLGEFSDHEHPCFEVLYHQDQGIFSITSSLTTPLKFPEGSFKVRFGNNTRRVSYLLDIKLPEFDLVTRLFLDEEASQQGPSPV